MAPMSRLPFPQFNGDAGNEQDTSVQAKYFLYRFLAVSSAAAYTDEQKAIAFAHCLTQKALSWLNHSNYNNLVDPYNYEEVEKAFKQKFCTPLTSSTIAKQSSSLDQRPDESVDAYFLRVSFVISLEEEQVASLSDNPDFFKEFFARQHLHNGLVLNHGLRQTHPSLAQAFKSQPSLKTLANFIQELRERETEEKRKRTQLPTLLEEEHHPSSLAPDITVYHSHALEAQVLQPLAQTTPPTEGLPLPGQDF